MNQVEHSLLFILIILATSQVLRSDWIWDIPYLVEVLGGDSLYFLREIASSPYSMGVIACTYIMVIIGMKNFESNEKEYKPNFDKKEIKVLTLNVFLRPPFVKNNADDFKNERLKEFMKIVKEQTFDVIALQEIFSLGNTRPKQLIQFAKECGYYWNITSSSPFPKIQKNFLDAGLLILSRYPLSEKDFFIYTKSNQIDSWVSKQVICAKVQVSPDYYFHIFTTHMQASYYDSSEYHNKLNDQSRLYQIDEMSEFIHSKVINSPFPALITGDFNVNSRSDKGEETEEYLYLIKKLNQEKESCTPDHFPVVDLLKAHTGTHGVTYGDVHPDSTKEKLRPRETVLTHKADIGSQLCIDYLIFLDCKKNQQSKTRIEVKEKSTKIYEFFVDDHKNITQVSDHYGVGTTLQINSG